MELSQALIGRKSVRAFKPDPVAKGVLDQVVKSALRAPSWGNTQPWEVAVLAPNLVKKLGEEFVKRSAAGEIARPDFEMPSSWPDPQKQRYGDLGRELFTAMGIERGDKEARNRHYLNMYRFFGAPNAIYVFLDKGISPYYGTLDVGALAFAISLVAHDKGLGTCIMAAVSGFPDVVRGQLGLSADKKLVIGIGIGYPDLSHPSSRLETTRDESVITWHGF